MIKKSLYKELKRNLRVSEDSGIVVSAWGATADPYLPEIPDVESGTEQCRESYFNITAERLLFRKKLLGLPVDENLVADEHLITAHPFGEANPTFGELAEPSVRLAAAFVPLTSDENDVTRRPVMARLYCVAGLPGRCALPLTEGLSEAGIQNYNWFVAGVKDDVLKMGISGRSWLLAANLLMQIIGKNDMATARNLINNFVVTGNVEDGAISHVTIGRKQELGNIKEFRNLKWIIPMKNANEMTAVPVRRIEKPATLDEAYTLIETMQSKVTRTFFSVLKNGDLAVMKDLYDIGADIFAREKETDLTCLEIVADLKAQLHVAKKVDDAAKVDPGTFQKDIRERIAALDKVDRWLRFQGADSSMMFYLMAVNGDEASIARCCEYASINSCDEHGHTAVDLALINEKFEAARLLHRYGGAPNPRMGANKQLADAIKDFCDEFFEGLIDKDKLIMIVNAVDTGFSPETFVEARNVGPFKQVCCTLYAVAVDYACYEVLEACLRNGADANKKLLWTHFETDGLLGETHEIIHRQGTPWAILSRRGDMKGEERQKFRALLQRYGAKIDEE